MDVGFIIRAFSAPHQAISVVAVTSRKKLCVLDTETAVLSNPLSWRESMVLDHERQLFVVEQGSCVAFLGKEDAVGGGVGAVSIILWDVTTDTFRYIPLKFTPRVDTRALFLNDFSISPCMTRCSFAYSCWRWSGVNIKITLIFDFNTGELVRELEGVVHFKYASGAGCGVVLM